MDVDIRAVAVLDLAVPCTRTIGAASENSSATCASATLWPAWSMSPRTTVTSMQPFSAW